MSEEQLDEVPDLRIALYVEVPPDHVPVKIMLCPGSIVAIEGVNAFTESAGLTVISVAIEFSVAGTVLLSVTDTQ